MKKNIIVLFVLVALVVGVGSFYGGMTYAKSSNKFLAGRSFNDQQFIANVGGAGQRAGGAMAGRAGGAGGFISGQVVSKDSQSITVSIARNNATGSQNTTGQAGGGSKIVFFSNSTQVMKTTEGSTSDIAVGSNLTITGAPNSDGSITAQSIQIRPSVPVAGK
ncbi:MAG: DUF5666 domain-containing protein [Candidatus Pacebacteria bacterium]|nr:DUF5666 domain-containing protein [Candidatus Paceibacterota bacterium]